MEVTKGKHGHQPSFFLIIILMVNFMKNRRSIKLISNDDEKVTCAVIADYDVNYENYSISLS